MAPSFAEQSLTEQSLAEHDSLPANHTSPTLNWVLALCAIPAAIAVMAYSYLQVLGTAACASQSCPRIGPGELGYTLIVYGAPAVAVLAVLLSFVTARKRLGILVPIVAYVLLVVAAVVLFLTFP